MNDLEVRLVYKRDAAEDWTKVDDGALRKKLQNRLAKRKSRKKSTLFEESLARSGSLL